MSETTHTVNIRYVVEDINPSIRQTQRMLYFTNALRLSIVDIQQVMSGPTISNLMWTAVQLTRVWTQFYRMVKATNQAQQTGMGLAVGGAMARGAVTGMAGIPAGAFGLGVATGAPTVAKLGLWQIVLGLAAAPMIGPITLGMGVGAALISVGAVAYDMRERRKLRDWRQRQREIAKSQGLEN